MADSSQALPLIEGIEAEYLLADKAYDTNEIIARKLGMDGDTMTRRCTSCATCGERVLGVPVARDSDPLCQESDIIPGRLPAPGSHDLEQTLLTTPPSIITIQHKQSTN